MSPRRHAGILALFLAACSLGEGRGEARGELNVPDCWTGSFDLHPDFFAGIPYRSSLILKMQSGGDYATFSDSLSILVDDVRVIRGDNGLPSLLGTPLTVSLPPSVVPPGVPITVDPNPPLVHATLSLQRSCQVQNVALHAMREVALSSRGLCEDEPRDGGPPPDPCSASSTTSRVGTSVITFTHLHNANPDEQAAHERLNEASFELYLADPRETCPGQSRPPPCRGRLKGSFTFYFERGRPLQPFP